MNKWFEVEKNTNDSAIVVSTRIRLARNLCDLPFPDKMTDEQRLDLINKVENALKGEKFAKAITLKKIMMDELDPICVNAMVERRIISPQFAAKRKSRALFLSEDESVAVLVNEEDHIRIQVLSSGSDLPVCLKIATEIDTVLEKKLGFAFDKVLGYLTQCPTNLGTGLRASVMLHLPMLENNGMIESVANTVSKLGMTVRGSMGEGTSAQGALYQISNQVTLGISEQNAIDNLMSIVNQVITKEQDLRKKAYENDSISLNDKVYRAYGLLSSARLLSGEELLRLLSVIRLGTSIGILKTNMAVLNSLLFETGAYELSYTYGSKPDAKKRDELRANIVREKITA